MNFQTMSKSGKLILICVLLGNLCFPSWYSVPLEIGGSANGFSSSIGIFSLIGFLVLASFTCARPDKNLDKTSDVALLAGDIALLFTIIYLINYSGNTYGLVDMDVVVDRTGGWSWNSSLPGCSGPRR